MPQNICLRVYMVFRKIKLYRMSNFLDTISLYYLSAEMKQRYAISAESWEAALIIVWTASNGSYPGRKLNEVVKLLPEIPSTSSFDNFPRASVTQSSFFGTVSNFL